MPLGLFVQVWAHLRSCAGHRTGGAILIAVGVSTIGGALALGASHGYIIGGSLLFLLGMYCAGGEDRKLLDLGTMPAMGLAMGMLGLYILHDQMWTLHAPNDARLWYYFYNTLYLMLGAPFAIVGSLGLALLLNEASLKEWLFIRICGSFLAREGGPCCEIRLYLNIYAQES